MIVTLLTNLTKAAVLMVLSAALVYSAHSDSGHVQNCETASFVESFDQWAFGFADSSERRRQKLVKWENPVTIVSYGEGKDEYERVIDDIALEISEISGHPILYDGINGNSIIYISDDPVLTARKDPGFQSIKDVVFPKGVADFVSTFYVSGMPFCAGRLLIGRDYEESEIIGSIIFIDTSFGEEVVKACLREELAHSLGGVGDLTEAQCSIFDNRQFPSEFTNLDKKMIRLLYRNDLKPGMKRSDVLDIVSEYMLSK